MKNKFLQILSAVLFLLYSQSCLKPTTADEPTLFEKKAAIDPPVTYSGENLTGLDFPVGAVGGSVIRMNGKAERQWWQIFNNCLLARRLVENGVRFVQLYDKGWDMHGAGPGNGVGKGLKNKCNEVDQGMTALLMDLKQRGLLEETLVVWGGEFGRTPMMEARSGVNFLGRDHHNEAYTMWMAVGGIKKGFNHGETDELGYSGIKGRVHVHDIQATILNQLGLDHERTTYRFQGRDFRLTDVHGHVVNEVLA